MRFERRGDHPRAKGTGLARLTVSLLAALALLCGSAAAASAAAYGIVERPVSFEVANTNTSQAPCVPDGATYTIRGHITGPTGALQDGTATTIAVYLYGAEAGEWNWDLKDVPGYDYAAEMARLGHVSLTIDELGYGASDHPPNGNDTCQGAYADITHQIIQRLRGGDYALGTKPGIAFSRVVLVGHDMGGEVAEVEAYSYSDIDGLILATWADQGFTPYIIERTFTAGSEWCSESPSGYVHFVSSEEWRTLLFYDAESSVIEATDALRNPNPCGVIRSVPPTVFADKAHVAQITVPVLIVFGDNDTLVWSRQGEEQQRDNFTGSHDKTEVFTPRAGHFLMFEKIEKTDLHPFRSTISGWLDARFPKP
jgi:pimeloyl-ACP methyl ester carboxylesterase